MAKAKKTINEDRVAVLSTHVGEPLVIRANPSKEQVVGFVAEHNRRYHAGEAGGPDGNAAYLVQGAKFYENEAAFLNGEDAESDIDLSELE